MAKIQRGVYVSSPEKVTSGKMSNYTQSQFDSSDDDGPEEVTFADSKTVALQSVKDALESAKREKQSLKEKRRKRQELFLEQKKKRLLPEDLLVEIDTAPPKQLKPSEAEDEEDSGVETTKKKTKKETKARSLQGNYSVMRAKDRSTASSQQQTAMDFIQSRLYGPESQRTTSSQLLNLENKRGPNKGAAVQFANKKLGRQKEKAEKCNKRWIHGQKLVTS